MDVENETRIETEIEIKTGWNPHRFKENSSSRIQT